ncbi:MAG: peptide chain release factor N(5)-glutamine methyltransferase [Ruminococcaceae bacterium]|nr:peptide chain release factor N(5)-glutamine methyltransferase [Oscillospiraceae bacterium]
MVTLNTVWREAAEKLACAGVENARFEAKELVRWVYGLTPEAFLREKDQPVNEKKLKKPLAKRVAGTPLAHILGEWDFYGHTLKVTKDVLIPRADTETLVDVALTVPGTRFLDLCTGSGCVGIALALEREDLHGVLLDVSKPALKIARGNVKRFGLSERLDVLHGDVCRAPDETLGKFDFIVSNPPYITLDEMQELDRSVGFFEPETALYGGVDGFTYYDAILMRWVDCLNPGGIIAMECGYRQAQMLASRMETVGLCEIEIKQDTAGIDRVVLGKWK